jgi:hypothetical protein
MSRPPRLAGEFREGDFLGFAGCLMRGVHETAAERRSTGPVMRLAHGHGRERPAALGGRRRAA